MTSEPVAPPVVASGSRPIALVTGATAGLGAGYADRLAARGYDVVLVARDAGRLAEVAARLRTTHGVDTEVISADLSDRAALARVAARLAEVARPIEVLVNNAGFGLKQRFVDGVPADHERMFDVLCRAVMVLSQAAVAAMLARGHGFVLNVGSVAGLVAGGGHYAAAKAYVIVLTETLAGELRGTGVSATVVEPGYVRTEFHARSGMRSGGRSGLTSRVWLDVADVVDASLDDMFARREVSVPTRRWRVVAGLVDIAPRALVSRVWNRVPAGAARRHPAADQ